MNIKRDDKGFTIVELLVVIAIIGILAAIGVVSFMAVQTDVRNTQRTSSINILSEALEKYYSSNGEYPECSAIANPVSPETITNNVLKGMDPNVITGSDGNNIITCTNPPTSIEMIAYISTGLDYTLEYMEVGSNKIVSVNSNKQDTGTTHTLTLIDGTGGTVSGGGTYNADEVRTITATADLYYSFNNWTGSSGCSGLASHTITMDTDKTCTANFTAIPISAPTPPTVTTNTVGATTTWSWPAVSCGTNSVRYQYRYLIDSVVQSTPPEWKDQSASPVAFTTSTIGHTYTVDVQAQCYNTATPSDWSTAGSADYDRPLVETFTLTINAGTGGTVNSGGTYDSGTTQTITATPSTNYTFNSWTGSTGCSGIGSHTILMDANKSCTANFTYTPPTCPSGWTAGINTLVGDPGAMTIPTNLCVKNTSETATYFWAGAMTACNAYGARLPTYNEGAGLFFDVKYYGAYGGFASFANPNIFTWTSYVNPNDSTQAMEVSVSNSYEWFNFPGYTSKTAYALGVRCVKDI